MTDIQAQKEMIQQTIKGLNVGLVGTQRALDDAKGELYEAEIKGWPLEGKQKAVKFHEDRLKEINMQKKELWDMLYKIEQQKK